MSTVKKNLTAARIALLAAKNEQIFHTDDLGNLWLIKNKNSLYTLLKRYAQSGILHRIYRGLYSLVPNYQLDPLLLGTKALHSFCYLTTESVLFRAGCISQLPQAHTFVSEKSLTFEIGEHHYKSRQLDSKFLYKPDGIIQKGAIKIATPERAVADILYFNPYYHFDKRIDWRAVKKLQQKIGYPLTPHRYDSSKTN